MSTTPPRSGQPTSDAIKSGHYVGYDGTLKDAGGRPVNDGIYGKPLCDDHGSLTTKKSS